MTSVEIPLSIAAALPNLTVLDITNDVQREVAAGGGSGIAFVSPNGDPSLIRVQERETGFFSDLEGLLERLVPLEAGERERMVSLLLGPRTEQIPFTEGRPPRVRRDVELSHEIRRVYEENFQVYGARKVSPTTRPGGDHRCPLHDRAIDAISRAAGRRAWEQAPDHDQ